MNLIRDLEGNEYPLQATITYDKELNGNQSISFRILPSKVNTFIHDITEMWEVVADTDYKIIYCKKRGSGDKLNVEIKAIPVFFDTFDTQRIYEEYNEHMTAQLCFNRIFQNSGYNVVLNGTFEAIQWEGFGAGDTRLTLFKNALNRYKAEFRIVGNTIYVENLIGRDTQFMYRYKLNASNIVQENDATAYYTYAKGYGNYSDEDGWQGAKLIREYTSPLAQIIGIRHAPPIQNGNITTNATMDEQLKTLVDESLKISVQANIHDLKDYPLAQPQVGDRSFLIDERIGLEAEVRINYLRITKDWQGNIRDIQATFGSPNLVKRHQSNMQNAVKNITQLLEGKVKLPFSVLDNAVAEATKALQRMESQLSITDNGSLMSVDKSNPNNVVLFNAAGLGVSDDGGATFKNAITGKGINASVIVTGTLRSIVVDAVEIYGSTIQGTNISGGTLTSEKSSTEFTKIQAGFIEARGKHTRTWRGNTNTHDVRLMAQNGYFRARNNNMNWSLYFSDWGISTYADGTGDDDSSGYIEFHSKDYSPTNSPTGLTIGSLAGRIGIETNNSRIYLNTGGSGVHVGRPDDETYYAIYAAAFTQSSARELKRDIKDLQGDAVEVVKSMRVREYKRLTNGEATELDKWQAGLILDEAPVQLVDGIGIDLYTGWAYTAKALQNVISRLEVLENGTT